MTAADDWRAAEMGADELARAGASAAEIDGADDEAEWLFQAAQRPGGDR